MEVFIRLKFPQAVLFRSIRELLFSDSNFYCLMFNKRKNQITRNICIFYSQKTLIIDILLVMI